MKKVQQKNNRRKVKKKISKKTSTKKSKAKRNIVKTSSSKKRKKSSKIISVIEKTTNQEVRKKLKIIFIVFMVGFGIWLLFNVLFSASKFNIFSWVKSLPYIGPLTEIVRQQIINQNPWGIYSFFLSTSLFFLPMPLELFYITFLSQGIMTDTLYPMTLLGIITAQQLNYILGKFFGDFMQRFVRKKTYDKMCATINKHGGYAIFLFHLFPLPYAILNFVAGVSRYPYRKWLALFIPALILNYGMITVLFHLL